MGCAGSKLEDLEAVALCRDRTDLLADAIRHRYALADAHAAYAHSLRSVGAAVHRLLDGAGDSLSPLSPVLPLPSQRKGDHLPSPPPPIISAAAAVLSPSPSNSHIHFHSSSDSGSDFAADESPLHSDDDDDSPHHHLHLHTDDSPSETPGPTFANLHYARNQPPAPSVSYEHRPQSAESIHFGSVPDPSSSPPPSYPNYNYPYSFPYPNPNPNLNPYPYSAPPPSYYGYPAMGGGFLGSTSPPPPPPSAAAEAGPSKSPPPPPSPPRASSWDFLNPFESQDSYYPPYTPSRSSRELREEEGIPDLEEEEQEVVKEAYSDEKFAPSSSGTVPDEHSAKEEPVNENSEYQSRSVEVEDETVVVDKNVVGDEVQGLPEEQHNVAPPRRQYRDVSEIASEIKVQFERACDAASELSKMLEVGKQLYRHRKSSASEVSSVMMMCVMPPSVSKSEDFLNFEEDMAMSSGNLSSTLQKLYMWEKKLHDEVRAEEKLRLFHDKNCKRLTHLAERGAEAHKLEKIQTLIRKLSTKLRVAIQVVDSISNKINKLMDEELWPQINELIQGLVKMWKVMLECYGIQRQAVSEAKGLDSIASGGKLGDIRTNAMMQLELELLRWIGNFSAWINAQKNYVKALNGWLRLCLHDEPEVTDDGVAPYSPGRLGAPPLFVICNYWSQAMDRISEKEVINAMQAFASNLRHLWDQHGVEQHQMMQNSDMDGLVKAREREVQIIHREVDALNKKLALFAGQNDLLSHTAEASSLHVGLRQIFEAMESFTADSLKAYEELHMCCEEEKVAREHAKVT